MSLPAVAGHDGFHRHAVGRDNTETAYHGVGNTRWDNEFERVSPDGCTDPFSGHPMYQTEWVLWEADATNWIELGTGHQCSGGYRYWFWGFGLNSSWYPRGTQTIPGTQQHEFRIDSNNTDTWYWWIDVTQMGAMSSSRVGHHVDIGLESWYANGRTPAHDYELMKYRRQDSTWVYFAGQNDPTVSQGMCGRYVIDSTWRAAQDNAC